jgi:broad specificity phosphatase PhoE
MRIYLVRHGESEGNALRLHQTKTTALSDIGKYQAALVGKRFEKIPVETIIASDYDRTFQTASIINSHINKPLESSALFRELKRPTEVEGKHENDPLVMNIKQTIRAHREDSTWHYSDEENFYDFNLRARSALRFLTERHEQRILVVSHGLFLNMILSTIIFGDNLNPSLFEQMYHQLHQKNTGITILEYDHATWSILTWNDHAHLD